MASTTARAALPYPTLPDTPDVPRDVKALADAVDLQLGAPSCTSTTRPTAGLYVGMLVYETDTHQVSRYNGTGWDAITAGWQAFTPTINGVATSSKSGQFRLASGTVDYEVQFVVSAAPTGAVTVNLPVVSDSYPASLNAFGTVLGRDVSAGAYVIGQAIHRPATAGPASAVELFMSGSSTNTNLQVVTTTVPFAWASGDVMAIAGTYRVVI